MWARIASTIIFRRSRLAERSTSINERKTQRRSRARFLGAFAPDEGSTFLYHISNRSRASFRTPRFDCTSTYFLRNTPRILPFPSPFSLTPPPCPTQLISSRESRLLFLSMPHQGQNILCPFIAQGKDLCFISLFTPRIKTCFSTSASKIFHAQSVVRHDY